jgi:uncharacterized protein YjiS (DUF1127 family)
MNVQTLQNLERVHGLDIPQPLVLAAISAMSAACTWIVDNLARWRMAMQARRDHAALFTMSDHMLRDIGVSRHEIALSVLEPRRRSIR